MVESLREHAIRELNKINCGVMQDKKLPGSPVIEIDLGRSSATDDIMPSLCHLPELQRLYVDKTW